VSAQALASSAFTLTEKQAIAKKAYLSARLTWLNSKECDALADSTVYALATAPDVMADRFAHSMFHDQMSVHTFNQQAQLLYLRPALIDAALASGDPQWYHAAACVPLSRDQQLALITLCEAYWSSSDEYRPDYLRNRSELLADPLSTLACTPWRIPEVEHRLANNPPLFKGAGTIKQGELQDGYYWRIDPSQYPPCDLASASAAQADTWVNYRVHALSSHSLAIPFVVLEAYRNKGLTAAQVSYRRNLLGTVAPSISSVLARRRRYVPKAGHATGLNYNPPERTARGPAPTPALPHVHVSWAWQNYDVGIAALTAAGLSDRQLELAYALILDSIDTDLAGLIALVTQL
jgi:hypothetical protein